MPKLIKSKAIITGTKQKIIPEGWILIEDGIISKTGNQIDLKKLTREETKDIQDLSDYYIMPGLIDAHTHLSIIPGLGNQIEQLKLPSDRNILRSIPNLYKNLVSGVTTMRVMGEENYIDIEIKKASAEGLVKSPRILASGIGIASINAHGAANTFTDGEVEIQKQIRKNFAKGADHVKIFVTGGISTPNSTLLHSSYSKKEIKTAVEEAARVGSYVAAHAHGGKGLDLCIENGVRTIEHGAYLDKKQLEKMIEQEQWLVSTQAILFHEEGIEKSDFSNLLIKNKVLKARKVIRNNFTKILKSKINLTVGTDSMHGLLWFELKFLTDNGYSTHQAVEAATSKAAKACQIDDMLGTLTPGKIADFIVLKENPLADIKALSKVDQVYKSGELVAENGNLRGVIKT